MIKQRKATIVSIAKEANVSRASVYAVLNATKPTNIGVSEKIRERINRVADELGYVRNENARTLVTGRTYTIGVILSGMENQFFDPMLDEIYRTGDERGYSISVNLSAWDAEREKRGIDRFCGNRFDGIIWVPITTEDKGFQRNLKLIESMNIPLVLIGTNENQESEKWCQVAVRDEEAVKIGMEYLYSLGHREIAIATASTCVGRRGDLHINRLEDILRLAKKKGINTKHIFKTSDNAYGGVGIASQIAEIPTGSRPSAIFAADDMLARGLIAGLTCLGVKVPEEISVLGCDDSPGNDKANIPLTSISLEAGEIGRQTLPLLFDLIDGKTPEASSRKIKVKPRLIERESCSHPKRSS